MTAKRDALVRCTRGVMVLGLLTGAGVLTAPASAASTSYITTMRSTQGKIVFSLRAMSVRYSSSQELQLPGFTSTGTLALLNRPFRLQME